MYFCNFASYQDTESLLSSDIVRIAIPILGSLFIAWFVYELNRVTARRRLTNSLKNEAAGIADRLKNIDYSIHMTHLVSCYYGALFKITNEKRYEDQYLQFAERQNNFVDKFNEEDAHFRFKLAFTSTYMKKSDRKILISLLEKYDNYATKTSSINFSGTSEMDIHREMVKKRISMHQRLNKKNRIDSLYAMQKFLNPEFYK